MLTRIQNQHEDTSFKILRLLEINPHQSQREIARTLGVSLGGLNYCLKALFQKGFLKMHSFQHNSHKRQYAYLLTPAGIKAKAELTGLFLQRKIAEYEALRQEIETLQFEVERKY
jgi:EPS-associated MarR family transcriptional regulator